MKDRLPPFSESDEKAVIGCCLNDPAKCIAEAAMVITSPDFFYDARCQSAWATIIAMEVRDVNIITVYGRMEMGKDQAIQFLNECQDAAVSTANLPVWLETVQSKKTLRQIIATCTKSAAEAYENKNADALLDEVEKNILKIRPQRQEQKDIRSLLMDAQAIIEFKSQNWGSISGLSTGLHDLDKKTDGVHKGELVVIAALPSCGKTALAVNIAIHNALQGIPIGILSAEMRPVQLVIRSICSESRVNFREIDEPGIKRMIPLFGKISRSPIHIETASGFTIGQAIATARRLRQKHGIQLLVVDYIQLFSGVGDNREQQIASVGRGMKAIASELDIPVLALSQLNDDGRLRESRAIGMDADSVWVIANDGDWQARTQPVVVRIEKCRDGETGIVPLTFLKEITRFECREMEMREAIQF